MKKYYAKNLPGEGKITEIKGTKVMSPVGVVEFILRMSTKDFKPTSDIAIHDGNTHRTFHESLIKPIKLFLCSRDIQIGDKIRYKDSNKKLTLKESGEITGVYCMVVWSFEEEEGYAAPSDLYKVIGEISSNAVWVKEGDEFEREDLLANGVGVNWNEFTNQNYKFKIKCSMCKTFH